MKVDINQVLDCDSNKHSPSYGYYVDHNLFGNTVMMIRCGGCGKLQSSEYQKLIESDNYEPPIYNGYTWVYPDSDVYQGLYEQQYNQKVMKS